jgi:hypothetical protein
MEVVSISPELKAQLDDYAQRHGQDLDDVLAAALEWERQDYDETVKGALEACEDVKARRTQSADEFLEELRLKHGLPC